MKKKGNIVVVDDNKNILSSLQILLTKHYEKVYTLSSPSGLIALLQAHPIDVVLLDMNFGTTVNNGNEGLFWLSRIKQFNNNIQVVLFTAYAEIELAVRGIKEGASDFLVKPWDNENLLRVLENAYMHSNKLQNRGKNKSLAASEMFWGDSKEMLSLKNFVTRVAQTSADILITGENGTGKEMLAREIHRLSMRAQKPMLSVDMGAVTETLFESELFGHVKGAFTDAKTDREGKFEAAHNGTLFMDEIGNLPMHLQSKLLSVLQSRTVTRVGSNKPTAIDFRLICATNCNLPKMVADGTFREDLLYRINTVHLEVPALRKRPEDIIPLAKMFLERYTIQYASKPVELDDEAVKLLQNYQWPGNIRELQHTMERAVIFSGGGLLSPAYFTLNEKPTTQPSDDTLRTLDEVERCTIENAMRQCNGNLSLVASQLGITRQTLYNKLRKHNL